MKNNRNKYNVDKNKAKRTYNNIVFDSILEMRYYKEVLLPKVESGLISHYELQKEYELQPKFVKNGKSVRSISYIADFYIEYKNGNIEVIDTKGIPDMVAKLKRKLFWFKYPDLDYKWISYSVIDGGWIEYEELKKRRFERKKEKLN